MCLACTTLHGQAPRPETTTACSAPRMFAHYVREIIRQTNPDKYIIRLPKTPEGSFLHPNDAIGDDFVSPGCTIFLLCMTQEC